MSEPVFRKRVLVDGESLAGNFISDTLDVSTQDNVGLQLEWDGDVDGTFAVEVSNSNDAQSSDADVRAAAVWDALELSDVPTASGAPGTWAINLNQVPFQSLRLNYSSTVVEQFTVDTILDSSGSLNSKYFLFGEANGDDFYAWMSLFEVATVTTAADVAGSKIGTYFLISEPATGYYVWFNAKSVFTVTTVADVAGSLNSTYFLLNETGGLGYYVWFNVNSAGVDPAVAGRTGIEVALATDASAATVAAGIETAVELATAINVTTISNVCTCTQDVAGAVTDAGAGNSGFTVATTTQGGTDPAVAGRTAIAVTIASGDTANAIAALVETAVEAATDINVSTVNNVCTCTQTIGGNPANPGAGTSGFTVAVTYSAGTDPAVADRTGIRIDYSVNDANTAVAAALEAPIEAATDIGVSVVSDVATFTQGAAGHASPAAAGDSGFTVTTTVSVDGDLNVIATGKGI